MAREKELSLVSIVAAADKKKEGFSYPLFSVSALESDFGATIEVEPVVSDQGQGKILRVAKYQLQMTLLPLRIEVSYLGGQATAVPVDRMAQMFKRLTDEFPADMWTRLGYNFIYIIDCETKAIDVIAKQTIKTDVAGKLGATLLGAATWLWVQLDDSVLWVRLEPRNSDAQSKRASVNANFTASITGAVPAKEELARRLSTNMRTLEHMLGEIGLW